MSAALLAVPEKEDKILLIRTPAIRLTRIKEELEGRLTLWVYVGEISCDIVFVLLDRLLSLLKSSGGFISSSTEDEHNTLYR